MGGCSFCENVHVAVSVQTFIMESFSCPNNSKISVIITKTGISKIKAHKKQRVPMIEFILSKNSLSYLLLKAASLSCLIIFIRRPIAKIVFMIKVTVGPVIEN
jgi:hypothetical protein